jgi:tetratricopeptide (TPR) repeat protein
MQPRPRKILSILPLALLFSTAGFAQLTAINGDVKGVDGKPVIGALVKIERTDQKGSYKVKTDKKGHYYYGGLGLGIWNVTIEVDGKDVDMMKGVNTQHGDAEVSFDLKKTADRNAAAAASASAGAPAPPAAEPERGMTAAQKAEFEKKKKEAEAAMAKQKDLNDAFSAGRAAEDAKSWDMAIEQFKKASEIDPKQHVVLSHLADCYIKRGDTKSGDDRQADYTAAVDNYKKALELSPEDPVYHNNYALALVKDKKVDEAQGELTKAAQLDPTSAGKYYYNLGAVLANVGQADPAGDAFKKSIAADPNYAEAYYQLGIVLVGKATTAPDGKIVPPAGTAEAFQKYLELAPTGPNADAAKGMLASMGASIDLSYQKPGSKSAPPANANKKK